MDMVRDRPETTDNRESDRQIALLKWATSKVDAIAERNATLTGLDQLIDCMAYFTREYFGFQERVLKELSEQRAYLLDRIAVHHEFRHRLAEISLDALRGDAGAADRLSSLCHDLSLDAQYERETLARIIRESGKSLRQRRQPRREAAAFQSALQLDP